jgi:hypothetical protein
MEEQDLVLVLGEAGNVGVQLVERKVDGAGQVAGFEFGGAADVDEQTPVVLIFAGEFVRFLAGAPEVDVGGHEHEEKCCRKYETHGFVIFEGLGWRAQDLLYSGMRQRGKAFGRFGNSSAIF